MPDPDFSQTDDLRHDNLEVTFENEEQARRAVHTLKEAGIDADVTVDSEADRRAALRAEMRDEVEAAVLGPGNVGPMTKAQTKGVTKWVGISTLVGGAVMLVLGLLVWPTAAGVLATTAVGVVAGATFGLVAGGIVGPSRYGKGHPDSETHTVVGVHASSPEEIVKAERLIGGRGVIRADRVSASGRPVSEPQTDTRAVRGEPPT